MPQPTAGDVHVNRPLSNISIAYLQAQEQFIATKVFPNIPVQKSSDSYFTYPKQQWFRTDAKERPPATESAGSGYDVSTENYSCTPFALHKDIDDQLRANADAPINLDAEATEFVTRGLALKREKDWAAKYFTTSVWSADVTPSPLWDAASSVPFDNIRAQADAIHKLTGYRPNTLVLSRDVWSVLQDHEELLDRIKYTQKGIVTTDLLASVLELDKVLIASAVEDTANEKATASMAFLMSKDALLVYAAPRPSLMHPSGGYTFSWNGYLGASAEGTRIKRFRMEKLASDRVEGEMAYDQKVVATDLGVFFNNVIS
jgi:hypothetical protein